MRALSTPNIISIQPLTPGGPTKSWPLRLIPGLRERVRYRHYSLRTRQADVEQLSDTRRASSPILLSAPKQALCALLFLYHEVLGQALPWTENLARPKSRVRVPAVLSRDEVARLLGVIDGVHGLIARILYGTGMRLMRPCR